MKNFIEQYNPSLQRAWFVLRFAAQSKKRAEKKEYLNHFWSIINEYYAAISQYDGFQCTKGCSHCCFDNPHGVSSLEIQRILPKITEQQKKQIALRYKEWTQLSEKHPDSAQNEWKKSCIPCPFLESNTCSIYDVRPLACRSFFSLKNSNWCHPKHPNYQDQPQIGNDDIHSLLERISIDQGWSKSGDLLSGIYEHITEANQ